jgi:large subunit ribosomal protein L3
MLLGKKIGMSQIFKDGKVIPVTIIEAGPCVVLDIKKNPLRLVLGFEEIKKAKKIKKTKPPFKYIREFRVQEELIKDIKVGDKINVSFFKEGDKVNISGISKGKGFQGVVKRHGFSGGPKSHGQQDRLRHPGSIGPSYPQRVFKGRKMAGRMGNKRVTVKNLKIVDIDPENNLLALKGSVPGQKGGLLEIRPYFLTRKGVLIKK